MAPKQELLRKSAQRCQESAVKHCNNASGAGPKQAIVLALQHCCNNQISWSHAGQVRPFLDRGKAEGEGGKGRREGIPVGRLVWGGEGAQFVLPQHAKIYTCYFAGT